MQCVPKRVLPPNPTAIMRLADLIGNSGDRTVFVTGAGVSTESGIPDYRSPNGSYSRGHKPADLSGLLRSHHVRQRYWARTFLGWQRFHHASPNEAHRRMALLEDGGFVRQLITQNVDQLHQRAGSKRVVNLHGNNHEVRCVACGLVSSREAVQDQIAAANPTWRERAGELKDEAYTRPDGDLAMEVDFSSFVVPDCTACGGLLKPNVVMFGENVPKPVVEHCYEQVGGSRLLVALGTSLQVYSIYRFVLHAVEKRIPVVAVNIGPTRGDGVLELKIEDHCSAVLRGVCGHLQRCHALPPDPPSVEEARQLPS